MGKLATIASRNCPTLQVSTVAHSGWSCCAIIGRTLSVSHRSHSPTGIAPLFHVHSCAENLPEALDSMMDVLQSVALLRALQVTYCNFCYDTGLASGDAGMTIPLFLSRCAAQAPSLRELDLEFRITRSLGRTRLLAVDEVQNSVHWRRSSSRCVVDLRWSS